MFCYGNDLANLMFSFSCMFIFPFPTKSSWEWREKKLSWRREWWVGRLCGMLRSNGVQGCTGAGLMLPMWEFQGWGSGTSWWYYFYSSKESGLTSWLGRLPSFQLLWRVPSEGEENMLMLVKLRVLSCLPKTFSFSQAPTPSRIPVESAGFLSHWEQWEFRNSPTC